MLRMLCKSKIHGAVVTDVNLNYTGSIAVDQKLMEEADIFPSEMVLIVNLNNGNRFETYVIPAGKNSGKIGLRGGAAHLGKKGDKLIIISYALLESKEAKEHKQKKIIVDENNKPKG